MSFRENKTLKMLSLFQENCLIHTEMHQKFSITSTSLLVGLKHILYICTTIQYKVYTIILHI